MLRERGRPGAVQVPRQPAHHVQRLDIEVGPLGPPAGDQVVNLVRSGHSLSAYLLTSRLYGCKTGGENLDIKKVCRDTGSPERERPRAGNGYGAGGLTTGAAEEGTACGTRRSTGASAMSAAARSSTWLRGSMRPIPRLSPTSAAARGT